MRAVCVREREKERAAASADQDTFTDSHVSPGGFVLRDLRVQTSNSMARPALMFSMRFRSSSMVRSSLEISSYRSDAELGASGHSPNPSLEKAGRCPPAASA